MIILFFPLIIIIILFIIKNLKFKKSKQSPSISSPSTSSLNITSQLPSTSSLNITSQSSNEQPLIPPEEREKLETVIDITGIRTTITINNDITTPSINEQFQNKIIYEPIKLYSNKDNEGEFIEFNYNESVDYPNVNINFQIKSISIPDGLKIRLYHKPLFQLNRVTYNTSNNDIQDMMKIESIQIRKKEGSYEETNFSDDIFPPIPEGFAILFNNCDYDIGAGHIVLSWGDYDLRNLKRNETDSWVNAVSSIKLGKNTKLRAYNLQGMNFISWTDFPAGKLTLTESNTCIGTLVDNMGVSWNDSIYFIRIRYINEGFPDDDILNITFNPDLPYVTINDTEKYNPGTYLNKDKIIKVTIPDGLTFSIKNGPSYTKNIDNLNYEAYQVTFEISYTYPYKLLSSIKEIKEQIYKPINITGNISFNSMNDIKNKFEEYIKLFFPYYNTQFINNKLTTYNNGTKININDYMNNVPYINMKLFAFASLIYLEQSEIINNYVYILFSLHIIKLLTILDKNYNYLYNTHYYSIIRIPNNKNIALENMNNIPFINNFLTQSINDVCQISLINIKLFDFNNLFAEYANSNNINNIKIDISKNINNIILLAEMSLILDFIDYSNLSNDYKIQSKNILQFEIDIIIKTFENQDLINLIKLTMNNTMSLEEYINENYIIQNVTINKPTTIAITTTPNAPISTPVLNETKKALLSNSDIITATPVLDETKKALLSSSYAPIATPVLDETKKALLSSSLDASIAMPVLDETKKALLSSSLDAPISTPVLDETMKALL